MASKDTNLANLGQVREIWRYPVKSMLGESIVSARLTERGVLGDRAYAMIDVETGKVVSAKNPRKWPSLFEFRSAYTENPSIDAPAPMVTITLGDGRSLETGSSEIEDDLSSALGRRVRLARSTEISPGARGEGYWPDHDWLPDRNQTFDVDLAPGTFFDGASFHLITTATLEHLNSLNPSSRFDVRRFRPNVLIQTPEGATGFVENGWIGQTLRIGDARIRIDRPCPRCVMTTLPQQDLPKDPAILRTAVQKNAGNVGVYATILQEGDVHLRDSVAQAS